jgi:hypothetical protein
MLWYFNALPRFSGRKPALPPWGEELVDQSLATAWYRADWDSVGDDELTYFLPSLRGRRAAMRGDAAATSGPVNYLTRTLLSLAHSTARKVAQVSSGALSASDVLKHFTASGLLTAVDEDRLSAQANSSGSSEPLSDHAVSQALRGRSGVPNWLVADLTALAYADRMLKDAMEAEGDIVEATPLVDWQLSLTDVFVATASTRLNGGYVYPNYDWAHEMLSLAAVMGHLVQGRTVYFPPFLARALTDVLSARRDHAADDIAAAVRTYADLAGGAALLTGKAKLISALGKARRVSPRPAVTLGNSTWEWNARLLQKMDARGCWPNLQEA